jgi:hypothetical protein
MLISSFHVFQQYFLFLHHALDLMMELLKLDEMLARSLSSFHVSFQLFALEYLLWIIAQVFIARSYVPCLRK